MAKFVFTCKHCKKGGFQTKEAAHGCCKDKRAAEAAAKAATSTAAK